MSKKQESLKEAYEKCPFGCIFDMGRLTGDCRIPWSDKCAMNCRKRKYNENKDRTI